MSKQYISTFLGILFYFIISNDAFAQDINDIADNVVTSTAFLPYLVSGLAFLSGILIATTAVFKTIDHVSNPSQTPIRVPVIRFLIGGGLFAMPIIMEAALNTINGGTVTGFNPMTTFSIFGASGLVSLVTGYLSLGNFNSILNSIMFSIGEIPGMVAAVAYLLGLVMTVSGIYKTRDHVENPDSVPLKDVVIRFLTAGMLFGLPTVFQAMFEAINGSGFGLSGVLTSLLTGAGFFYSTQAAEVACTGLEFTGGGALIGVAPTLGTLLCTVMETTMGLPGFLAALSYVIGTVFGLWAIIKIRDHVNNPSQTPLHEGITRLIAGGAFFALPVVAVAIQYSITPNITAAASYVVGANSGFVNTGLSCGGGFSVAGAISAASNAAAGALGSIGLGGVAGSLGLGGNATAAAGVNSLDQAMACFMENVLGPTHTLLNFFTFVAGLIFIMIGISRLTKSAQEGARGPGGIGTLTTFVVGGILMSFTAILKVFTGSMFGSTAFTAATQANLVYAASMSTSEQNAAYNVINAVLQFMIIIGMISFVRGIFIMRDVAEGSGQASVMSGMTHIIGGALAVNMGPLMNLIQNTLGITAFGVTFS